MIECRLARLALYLVLALTPAISAAAGYGYNSPQYGEKNPFRESMRLMMDAMGLDKSTGSGSDWWRSGPSEAFSSSPWSQGWPGMMSSMPGTAAGQDWMRQMPGANMPWFPGSTAALDGVWQGASGEMLEIRGDRFRLAAGAGYVEGWLRTKGNVLSMRTAQTNTTRTYEYATSQGRLALRDVYGQLLLYRKVSDPSQNPSAWSGGGWN